MINFEFYDALWVRRYQNDAEADVLEELSRLLFGAASQHRNNSIAAEIAWRRARCSHFAGMRALENESPAVAQTKFADGATLVDAISKDSSAANRFWWAVNAVEAARLKSKFASLRVLPAVKEQLKTALELDESFHFAGPHRVLGRIFHLTPRILGGDMAKAESHFRRAVEVSDNSTTRIYLGDLLLAQGRQDEAIFQWETILSAPDEEEWRWEQARDRRLAEECLKRD